MGEGITPVPIRPRRKISGISAILLAFEEDGTVDWSGVQAHVERTCEAGLMPAVNMDTGYGNLIDDAIKHRVLELTEKIAGEHGFVAGAFVPDQPGDEFALDAYSRAMESIEKSGGIPVIFQSFGLTRNRDEKIVEKYRQLASRCNQLIAFELGEMFAPFGAIYSLEVYRELMKIPNCIGAKHSSLSRQLEWERLKIRDSDRPDFKVYTGNDLAIDMVMYGSDYLLGLSTFAPDYFAIRDQYWLSGDPRFYELNDILQFLGFFAFRQPVPAYKHDAAMFLKIREWIASNLTHPSSPKRPESDIEVLKGIMEQLAKFS